MSRLFLIGLNKLQRFIRFAPVSAFSGTVDGTEIVDKKEANHLRIFGLKLSDCRFDGIPGIVRIADFGDDLHQISRKDHIHNIQFFIRLDHGTIEFVTLNRTLARCLFDIFAEFVTLKLCFIEEIFKRCILFTGFETENLFDLVMFDLDHLNLLPGIRCGDHTKQYLRRREPLYGTAFV